MCGRTASTLSKESIMSATAHKDESSGQYIRYEWSEFKESNDKPIDSYEPNFNQTSGHYLPVLVSKKLITGSYDDSNTKVLTSMRWGLKPDWIKSEDNSFNVKPINCRLETITEKKMFSSALKRGQRCVVLVDGFFEWKAINKTKEPYFLYFPQKYIDYKSRDTNWSQNQSKLNEDNEWKGPRLLTIAGIFNKTADNSLSFAVITVPSHSSLEWLHNRMPAILETNQSVRDWLDFDSVSTDKALQLLAPFGGLQYHCVSTLVSNVRNNSIENLLPNKPKDKQKTIDHWFANITTKKSLKKDFKEDNEESDASEAKKLKKELI